MPPSLGQRVAALREARGWTQWDVAERMRARGSKIDPAGISKIENGATAYVRPDRVAELARVFGVTADYLLGISAAEDMSWLQAPAESAATTPPAGGPDLEVLLERRERPRAAGENAGS